MNTGSGIRFNYSFQREAIDDESCNYVESLYM